MMYITFKGVRYEVPYNRDTLKLNMVIDSTFDNGFVKTIHLSASSGLDFSRRIPRGLLVEIEIENRTFTFKTGETSMDKVVYGTTPKYEHSINLISLSKELTKKTLENITLKQPKGDLGVYSRCANATIEYLTLSNTTPYTISYINIVNTNTSKFSGLSILSLEEYRVSVVIDYYSATQADLLEIKVKYGSSVVKTDQVLIPLAYNGITGTKTITFNYNPTYLDNFSVEVKRSNSANESFFITQSSFSITSLEVIAKPVRTYAQLVDKMLRNTKYVLSSQARAKLFLTAPEGKFENYSLYDGLQKIGGELGALVRVGDLVNKRFWGVISQTTEDIIGDSLYDFSPYDYDIDTILKIGTKYYKNTLSDSLVREVNYDFFDNPKTIDLIGERNRTEVAEFEDYVSALELNTKNVIKPIRYSPFKNGWATLRNLDGIGQMTTQNIGYLTEDKQERIIKVLVKGLASQSANHSWTVNDVTDITQRVVDKKQYDTFPSQAIHTVIGKEQYLKNNTLYIVQGDNKIYGMSYLGEKNSTFIGQPNYTRALYETILAARTVEVGELVTRTGNQAEDDPGLPGDLQIQIQIEYQNQTESRARVYKKDQSGFEEDYVKYINESANVNDTESIGNYAAEMVNRLGGTKIIVDGVVDSLDELPNLGDIDSYNRVYTIFQLSFGKKITYSITMVKDYNIISSYIGINSRHRVEEISNDSSTRRTLRYTSKVTFTENRQAFNTRLVNPQAIMTHLLGNSLPGLNYGYIEFYHSNGDTKKVHTSVDTDSKGQTIEIKWNMFDNYSAGLKRYMEIIGGENVYLNSEVPYTDYYGKVSDLLFSIHDLPLNTYDKQSYPEATTNDGDEMFTIITDTIDKDEGEILCGLIEIPIFSQNDKIRVYNGFAKYNALLGGSNRIQAVSLDYVPLIKDNKIDLTRVRDITVTGTLNFDNIVLDFALPFSSKGIAFYNVDTLDLLLVYIDNLPSGTNQLTLYYSIEDSINGGGENLTYQIIVTREATIGFTSSDNRNGYNHSASIIKTSEIATAQDIPYWGVTTRTDYDGSVDLTMTSFSESAVTSQMNALYPAGGYPVGYLMRIGVYSNGSIYLTYRERKTY